MGIPDNSIYDIIEKVKSWISWGNHNISGVSQQHLSSGNSFKMCCDCKTQFMDSSIECPCHSCGRVLCRKCMEGDSVVESEGRRISDEVEQSIKLCRYCEYNRKIDPTSNGKFVSDNIKSFQSDNLLRFLEAKRHGSSTLMLPNSSVPSPMDTLSPVSFVQSSTRSDDEDNYYSEKHLFSPSSEYYQDISDIDSRSISARNDFFGGKSLGSSPLGSPSRMTSTPRSGSSVQQEQEGSPVSPTDAPLHQEARVASNRPDGGFLDIDCTDYGSDASPTFHDKCNKVKQPLDYENNGLIWLPPPPYDEEDEMENSYFEYDDEDDEIGESGMFTTSSFSTDISPSQGKTNQEQKEPLRAVVHGHFRALVVQLLQGEDINVGTEHTGEGWVDIVTSLAWQAANFVKPDTRRGGSMDPGDYVKVKCLESGTPNQSTLIKGVVCTKNIKHKRMTSQYKNPKLLLLGGALEYQRATNQLASFDTLLQQEIDHLKMIVSKIEAHHPNVLLVEKSVSSYAQEYLLAKEISLVLNVKRSLLERVARCTGAYIVPSIDNLSSIRLGHCEVFRLEKVVEECGLDPQANRKSAKTLMFFEGCPRRLGCTVLLKGGHKELLKKIKSVVQYAVFAAYHLSLETSFLADEGATLLKMPLRSPVAIPGTVMNYDGDISLISNIRDDYHIEDQSESLCEHRTSGILPFHAISDVSVSNDGTVSFSTDFENESSCFHPGYGDSKDGHACHHVSSPDHQPQCNDWGSSSMFSQLELMESSSSIQEKLIRHQWESTDDNEPTRSERVDGNEILSEHFSAVDNYQSILVSFSSHCVPKGTVCERSQLLRIKFYGNFDKPLGRYLQDDLFNKTAYCRSCKDSTDAHVRCYTHQQGSLTINVRRLLTVVLPGEHDGKIWMWHRCLKCAHVNGVPPANQRVLMSDAAWGLSFGKFLELSFSNHVTANRVASCGHSLQRDCLRFYGFGNMVAFFRYSPIDILSVCLPPPMLEFSGQFQQDWVRQEAVKLYNEMEVLYAEVFDTLHSIEQKGSSLGQMFLVEIEFHNHVTDLKVLLKKERNEYESLLHPVCTDDPHYWEIALDILELNRLKRCVLMDSYIWDHRLYSLESLLKNKASMQKIDTHMLEAATYVRLKEWRDDTFFKDVKLRYGPEDSNKSLTVPENSKIQLLPEGKEDPCLSLMEPISVELNVDQVIMNSVESYCLNNTELTSDPDQKPNESCPVSEIPVDEISPPSLPSPASYLSDKIDFAWTGRGQPPPKEQAPYISQPDIKQTLLVGDIDQLDNRSCRMLKSPVRVHSFDSAMRIQEKIRRGLSPSLQLSSIRSFHASGEFRDMVRDPIPNILRTLSQTSSRESQKLSFIFSSIPLFISSASNLASEGARLLLPQTGHNNIVIPVYDNEPASVVSHALGSKEYEDWIADKLDAHGSWNASESNREDELVSSYSSAASTLSAWQSFGSLDSEEIVFRSDASLNIGRVFLDQKKSPHFTISFEDEYSSAAGKVKFSVICYFARQFDALRKKCCPSEVDFIRSLSRCKRWSAQGGKSNVYFAKSFDERFIIKQVTKTELDSFVEFAPQYFKYLTDSLPSGSPTCLAKVLGIYQVSVKHLKGGRQTKMEFMVMENLFFKRNISRVYDLKGSARSRYNPDTTGKNKVLLDMNLIETLHTNPLFLGSKAKRSLERAVWNDTFFLASVDVMDYSLLVGVDEDQKELVVGIIDFMRQYTWDKHLETWVKASGILGGPKNASPTVVSPMQYKKRAKVKKYGETSR
ncbi:1-phosphatidylinositol-3-phosphate 5-kinase FAB1A [Thalictrum thalictroides]|uniref:1-phosphatidylinositol-3-phosphate 5-kinase n=1 Tax=Thalictrum thalictroides TaxID=46969 RepID=A0A7J6XAL7_THATH|nr:1-phosphatidylinositol-3-phosphate 5-kinase FAB1A [Thalictrum thalictroides]